MSNHKITLTNTSTQSELLFENLHRYIHGNDIDSAILDDLRLAIEEIFINIVSYAYPIDKTHNIVIEFSHSLNHLHITFTDSGLEFNPLSCGKTTGDCCNGGMGIQLIKSLTDEQSYKRVNQHNVFTVTKHYTKKN